MALFVLAALVALAAPVVVELILEVLLAQVILHQFRLLKAIQAVHMAFIQTAAAVEAVLVLLVHNPDIMVRQALQSPLLRREDLEATE